MNRAQCKAARQLLYATQADLAKWAKVGLSTLRDFESDRRATSTWTHRAIMNTLERMGVEFIGSTGVRMRDGVAVKPKKRPAVVTMNDVAASAEWANKATVGVVTKRDALSWQPIDENTPRDRRLLLCIPFGGQAGVIVMGQWDSDRFARPSRPFWTNDLDLKRDQARKHQPTHWIDPQPPEDV